MITWKRFNPLGQEAFHSKGFSCTSEIGLTFAASDNADERRQRAAEVCGKIRIKFVQDTGVELALKLR